MSSFIKDRDAHTRGVNAIAAVDGVASRRRQNEARKAVAMNMRDRQMAEMSRNAFRPQRHPLGAVSMGTQTSFQQYSAAGIGVKGTNLTPTQPSGTGTVAPRPTSSTTTATWQPTTTTSRLPSSTLPSSSFLPSSGSRLPPLPTGSALTPASQTAPTSTSSGSITTAPKPKDQYKYPSSSSSGGGSSGGGGWHGMTPTDEGALAELDSPGAAPAAPQAAGKKTNYLLIAGIAIGAYLLFKKKG